MPPWKDEDEDPPRPEDLEGMLLLISRICNLSTPDVLTQAGHAK